MQTKIQIAFVEGFERDWTLPRRLRGAGFTHRFAVVQETAVPDHPDMYFDRNLMWALYDFARQYGDECCVTVADRFRDLGRFEQPIEVWRAGWETIEPDDRGPPFAVTVGASGRPDLCILTESWTHVGGPRPYADSWTYSVLSVRDLAAELSAFLAGHPSAGGWAVVPAVLDAPTFPNPLPPGPFSWLNRLFR